MKGKNCHPQYGFPSYLYAGKVRVTVFFSHEFLNSLRIEVACLTVAMNEMKIH